MIRLFSLLHICNTYVHKYLSITYPCISVFVANKCITEYILLYLYSFELNLAISTQYCRIFSTYMRKCYISGVVIFRIPSSLGHGKMCV